LERSGVAELLVDVDHETALEDAKVAFSSDFLTNFDLYISNSTISSNETVSFYEDHFLQKSTFEISTIDDISEQSSSFESESVFEEQGLDGDSRISGQTSFAKKSFENKFRTCASFHQFFQENRFNNVKQFFWMEKTDDYLEDMFDNLDIQEQVFDYQYKCVAPDW
jgi:hypothetical protein